MDDILLCEEEEQIVVLRVVYSRHVIYDQPEGTGMLAGKLPASVFISEY